MNKKPFSPKEFKEIYSRATRLCVDLVIKTPKGLALSLRSLSSWKGYWHLPGGTVFYKEKIIDTVRRVALEELGISVNVDRLLGYVEYMSEEKERGFGYTVAMVFLCSLGKDKIDMKISFEEITIKIKILSEKDRPHPNLLANANKQ